MPTALDFHRAGQEEDRIAARRAFDLAHRPREEPEVGSTSYDLERRYAIDRAEIKMRANWVTDDAAIKQRLRRMRIGAEAEAAQASARIDGPMDRPAVYVEAQQRMAQAELSRPMRGVPRNDW
jgi:hypothetical protein